MTEGVKESDRGQRLRELKREPDDREILKERERERMIFREEAEGWMEKEGSSTRVRISRGLRRGFVGCVSEWRWR